MFVEASRDGKDILMYHKDINYRVAFLTSPSKILLLCQSVSKFRHFFSEMFNPIRQGYNIQDAYAIEQAMTSK